MLWMTLLACSGHAEEPQKEPETMANYYTRQTRINDVMNDAVWMAEKNADRLSELFLENAQFVHMGGYWGKAQELQIIRSGGIWYKHAEVHSQEVKFAGSTATVYSRIHLTAAVGGNEVVNPFIVSEVFVMEDGKWRLSLLAFTRTIGD